jgi:deoxyribodipyrimidine photo-lyase
MIESLSRLQNDLQKIDSMLCFAQGRPEEIIKQLLAHSTTYDALFFNADYTPFSIARDEKIKRLCNRSGISCNIFHDALLIGNPASLINKSNTPYKKFSAFYATAQTINPIPPRQDDETTSCPLPTDIPSWLGQGLLPASLAQYTITQPGQILQ